ncbi:hypothetical protein [Metarhizobium album]
MAIDRRFFFDHIRAAPFGGMLKQPQVDGMSAILDRWERTMAAQDERWLAYVLATVYHETARTMQPVRETLADSDERAVAILEEAFAKGRLSWVKTPYWRPDEDGKSWLGRGFVQLTHRRNYAAMSDITGIDLVAAPERAMETETALSILFEGMRRGSFTGHKLADYFNASTEDWAGARKIVNGMDRAEQIGGYGRLFHAALRGDRGRG